MGEMGHICYAMRRVPFGCLGVKLLPLREGHQLVHHFLVHHELERVQPVPEYYIIIYTNKRNHETGKQG